MGKFKDLRVWQKAVELATEIYEESQNGKLSTDYGLRNQIRRAVVSIASNIAEGDERNTNKESIYFFNVAKGSAAEVITQLHIAYRIKYIDKDAFLKLEDKTEMIRASLKKLIAARSK